MTGSVAFGALARIVMVTARQQDATDGKPGPRTLMRAKSNIGPDDGGFNYELQRVPLYEQPDIIASVVCWGDKVDGSARDILAEAEVDDAGEARSAMQEAKDFLIDLLAGGPMLAKDVKKEAADFGASWVTIKRAKKEAGVLSAKDGMKGGWVWSLVGNDKDQDRRGSSEVEQPHHKSMSPFDDVDPLQSSSGAIDDGWSEDI